MKSNIVGSIWPISHRVDVYAEQAVDYALKYGLRLVIALVLLFVVIKVSKRAQAISRHFINKLPGDNGEIQVFVTSFIKVVTWIVGASLILEVLELSSVVSHIIAGAGIMGIIAGFAFKDVASNGFAGFLIKSQQPFKIGDWVQIGGNIGTVEEQGLINTGVRTITGQMAYIPNQSIFGGPFLNFSTFGKYRVIISMGVSYGDDLDKVEKVALETIRSLPMVEKDEDVDFYFTEVGSSTYNFQVRYWIPYSCRKDMLKATSLGIKSLKKAFEGEDINVAYNVMSLDFGVKGGVNLDKVPLHFKENEERES